MLKTQLLSSPSKNPNYSTNDRIKVYADGFVKIEGNRELYGFEAISKKITEKDNIINLYEANTTCSQIVRC